MRAEPGEDHAPTKFSISEVQGDRSACKSDWPASLAMLHVHTTRVHDGTVTVAAQQWCREDIRKTTGGGARLHYKTCVQNVNI